MYTDLHKCIEKNLYIVVKHDIDDLRSFTIFGITTDKGEALFACEAYNAADSKYLYLTHVIDLITLTSMHIEVDIYDNK